MEFKLTPQLKADWLSALQSGKYKQGYGQLFGKDTAGKSTHCCLGVLAVVAKVECPQDVYALKGATKLFNLNDRGCDTQNYSGGYSNVIPAIEQLETEN